MSEPHVVVVGCGAAGTAAGAELGPRVRTTVLDSESEVPYNRTAVNKGLLLGAVDRSGLGYPEATALSGVTHVAGRAAAVDPRARTVTTEDGAAIAYDALLIATGGRPAPAPVPATGAHRLYSPDDGLALRARVADGGRHVVVIGSGLIGTETAGVLHDLGNEVTVVAREPDPMRARWGSDVADWLLTEHEAAGTHLLLGREVAEIEAGASGASVMLTDGTHVEADEVVLAIGGATELGWLDGTGVAGDGLIAVDPDGRTPVEGIYAAGDVAAVGREAIRHRHWGAALHHGRRAAAAILADLGLAEPRHESPWLPSYSSYFRDAKLTVLGDATGHTAEHVIAGEPGPGRWTVALTDDDERVLGLVGVRGARVVTRLRDAVRARLPLADALALL